MSADRAESLRFYNYLCHKIGTEKIVKARRLLFIIHDAGAQSDFPQIGSGSKGEGLDLKGSDIDLMYIDPEFIVYESEKDVVKGIKNPLVMDTLDTQPCFTRLRVFNENCSRKRLWKVSFRSRLSKDIIILIMSLAHQIEPQTKYLQSEPTHKEEYTKLRSDLSHLLIGINSDAISGWMMVATLFYTHRKYDVTLSILNYAMSKCTDENIYIPAKCRITLNQTQQSLLDSMEQEKLITIMKVLTRSDLHFFLRSSVIPTELELDVIKCFSTYPHLLYAQFLMFLCYFHLNDFPACRHTQTQLRFTLARTIANEDCLFPYLLKSLVCCGITNQMLGEMDFARFAFQLVAQKDIDDITSASLRL
ncbi:unnamed protein product [Mytilus coruscus]|uniref:Mab-21-like HhH/H2TH-like domain-containing protein n=1 Tax=Mytilus coruscus TaxID=42192 RepID=A0A6J8F2X5_MYTCO|nr:unnamed protein product [Mytilus coruscus]